VGQFKRSVTVKCPIDKAFDYVSDWQNIKSFMSNIIEINPISLVQYGPGAAFDTTFKLGGANIPTTLEVFEFIRDTKLILKSRQGLKLTGGWEFKSVPEGTVLSFSLQYDLPPTMSRNEKEKQKVDKELDDAAVQSLQLLKWVLESRTMQNADQND